jgi:hypothetical protein
MISDAGVKQKKVALATDTTSDVLLALTISYSDGSGEELIGIQLSNRQLERLKQDIILYQESRNKAYQSEQQTTQVSNESSPSSFIPFVPTNLVLELDPKLVVIKNLGDYVEASVPFTTILGATNPQKLAILSRTEKEARAALNKKLQEIVYSVVVKHG